MEVFPIKSIIYVIVFAIVILGGCSNESSSDSKELSKEDNQETNESVEEKEADDTNKEKSEVESEKDSQTDLLNYRPEAGVTKTFTQNNEYQISYEIVAVNETHLQRLIKFGDMTELQILEWKPKQIAVVYTDKNPEDTSNQLDSFKSNNPAKTLIDLNKTGSGDGSDWEVIKQGEAVTVPAGTFEDVYVVKKTTIAETTGNKTIYQAYFAPEIGLIKDTREVTGDNGYQTTTVLTQVK